MNQHFEDELKTPGYREWDAFELRTLLQANGFRSRSGGCWIHSGGELGLVVTPSGLFVGWLDIAWPQPSRSADLLAGCRHLPKGLEKTSLPGLVEELTSSRRAAMTQCRVCGQPRVPGFIEGRTCRSCS